MSEPDDDEIDAILPDDQQENEEDLEGGGISYKEVVVMNADWTIETINNQVNKGNIDLDPGFQRRAAWDDVRRSRLMESILVGLPIPNIVLAENRENRGRFIVIDGKQRLLTINEFMANQVILKGLDLRPDLNGRNFESLDASDKEYLENNTLRATVIRNWTDENFLFTMFFRLNSGSLPLSPQELRKALIGGKLINAVENYISTSVAFHEVFGVVPDKRMRDSELVLRFIAFDRGYESYSGNLKQFLDITTRFYESNWEQQHSDLKQRFCRLDRALICAHTIFEDNVFKKWLGDGYERRINRAIFDCITRFFADEAISDEAIKQAPHIRHAYKEICQDQNFRDAIERTTKSQSATRNRIDLWGKALGRVLDKDYDTMHARLE